MTSNIFSLGADTVSFVAVGGFIVFVAFEIRGLQYLWFLKSIIYVYYISEFEIKTPLYNTEIFF